jgi:hypothetical protein
MTMTHLARTLRILLLLTLFVAGTGTHEEAMAQGPMAGDHSSMALMHHHEAPVQCLATKQCGTSPAPCCVAGQCLLGIACADAFDFPVALQGAPAPLVAPRLVAIEREQPYRPPQTI